MHSYRGGPVSDDGPIRIPPSTARVIASLIARRQNRTVDLLSRDVPRRPCPGSPKTWARSEAAQRLTLLAAALVVGSDGDGGITPE
jgi:hypothetical protein